MAHRILGIDFGTRTVKCAVVERSLRSSALVDFQTETVLPPFDDDAREAALERLLSRVRKGDDLVEAGLPAATCMHRVLTFPFGDSKSLKESVGFEFESHIPVDLEDVVVDFVVAGQNRDGDYEVLTVAAPKTEIERNLETLKKAGAEPRAMTLVPLACASMLAQLPQYAEGSTLLLDIGAGGTEAVVAQAGQAQYIRSLSVGSDDVRNRFVDRFNVDGVEGDLLVSHSVLLPEGVAARNPDEQALDEATRGAILPWLREVRQTLAFAARGARGRPDRMVLTGGMCRMRGLVEYVEAALGLPVTTLDLSGLEMNQLTSEDVGDYGAAAVALAMQGTDARTEQHMDFRQGELAFEGDYQFVRERLPAFAAFVVVALCLLGVRTTINYRALVSEKERQVSQLKKLSRDLTGKRIGTFSKLDTELARNLKIDLAGYYPDITAIRTFRDVAKIVAVVTEPPDFKPGGPANARPPTGVRIAQVAPPTMHGVPPLGGVPVRARMPARGGGGAPGFAPPGAAPGTDTGDGSSGKKKAEFFGHKIELLSMTVGRSKASMRGDCDTQDALLALQQHIGKHPCFHKIKSSSDRITFQRHKGWFRFNVGFEVRCPSSSDDDKAKKKGGKGSKAKGSKGKKSGAKAKKDKS
ncbi:MAG: pilus assembly protein PilM [Myxococcales bacterium]|nr:pilus assembly protein PilM [Myxococcales bacterium]